MRKVLTMISTPTCQIYPKFTLRLLDLQHLLGPQDLLHLLQDLILAPRDHQDLTPDLILVLILDLTPAPLDLIMDLLDPQDLIPDLIRDLLALQDLILAPLAHLDPDLDLILAPLAHLRLLDLLRLLDPPDPLVMNGTMKSAAPVPLEYGSTTTKSTTTQGKNPQWSGITELNSAPTCRNRSIIRLLHSVPLEVSKTVSPFMKAKVSWATNSWAPTMCLT